MRTGKKRINTKLHPKEQGFPQVSEAKKTRLDQQRNAKQTARGG